MKAYVIKDGYIDNGISFKIGDAVEINESRFQLLKETWLSETKPTEPKTGYETSKAVVQNKQVLKPKRKSK